MKKQDRPEDANKYIRPDPSPHIDQEKRQNALKQRRIWEKGAELLEQGLAKEFLAFLEDSGATSEQLARARELVKATFRI